MEINIVFRDNGYRYFVCLSKGIISPKVSICKSTESCPETSTVVKDSHFTYIKYHWWDVVRHCLIVAIAKLKAKLRVHIFEKCRK